MRLKKIATGAALAGALGLGALGFSGLAQAKPFVPVPPPPVPNVPGDVVPNVWTPGDPPGQNPFGPPGQVMQDPVINGVPNPLFGVPPGHWDDPAFFGLPVVWVPDWLPDVAPQPVVFNPDLPGWGIWWNGQFIVMPT